ncbi:hypothetical protein [Streptomyces cadmiisoli]|uniref:hypothetical protein n=1 Tax=Streptomyces cadmiisoli TaxID=2184053 RepID=UPI003663B50E
MAKCCGSSGCKCTVTAGPGVTVDGNGSTALPYVISADAATPTPVQAGDTPTVDTTVAGTGTAGDPYVVSAAVILDPTPPAGGTNLVQAGPDGLYVECADVRGCFSAGDGAAYDQTTGEISARVSGDAGNTTTLGTDGGLYTPAGSTSLQGSDTPSVDVTVSGTGMVGDPYDVSAAVRLDATPPGGGTNLIGEGPDGLFVECADVRQCFTAGDGASYDAGTGQFSARLSADAGNTVEFGSDGGLYSAGGGGGAPSVVTAGDTPTADTTVTGTGAAGDPYVVSTDVILDPTPPGGGSNLLQEGPDGLYVECADVRQCFTAGDGASYDAGTGEFSARLSADAGNTVEFGSDGGLYTPAATTALEAADTPTVDVTVTGTGTTGDPYQVAAAVILDPAPPGGGTNLINEGPDGLFLECAQVRTCLVAGTGITYDSATGEISAAGTALQAGDTNTVDTTVGGTGTAGDPYVVEADVIVAPEPNGLEATASGLLVTPSADAGNQLTMGGDGRLFVPPDAPLEVGCGLQGEGTVASPLAAFPVAGSQAWADDWACDAAVHSTLRCDPSSGALWTPPEHYTAADHLYIEHMTPAIASIGPTGGWVVLQPGGSPAVISWNVPANFLGNQCRLWSYSSHCHASVDVSITSTATFEVGYIYQEDGGPVQVRPLWGIRTAIGSARRERYAGSISETGFNRAPGAALTLNMFPAVNVIAGSIGINSWTSDGTIHTTTQG